MNRFLPASVLIFSFVFLWFPSPAGSGQSKALLIPRDQLVRSGHSVYLQVRIISGGLTFFQKPISGERVEFVLDDTVIGQSLSGGDGLAVRRFKPTETGLQIVTVRLAGGSRYDAEPVELLVSNVPADTPILLVHLSSTKTPGEPPAVPFSPAPTSEPMVGSVETLEALSEKVQLIFLETGSERLLPAFRDWLNGQAFPDAPLFVWSLSGSPENRRAGFLEKIEELKEEGWRNIRGGVTRSTDEAAAFAEAGITAILMMDEGEEPEVSGEVVRVTAWDEVPGVLKKR